MMKFKRKPLLAVTASLFMPGLGHIYNGQFIQGFTLLLLSVFITPFWIGLALQCPDRALCFMIFVGIILSLVFYLWILQNAYHTTSDLKTRPALTRFHPFLTTLALFCFGTLLSSLVMNHIQTSWIEAFKIPSQSMLPNLLLGDHLFVDKRINYPGTHNPLQRGEIVTFVYPNDRTLIYIKRIIGLPGDQIVIQDMDVLINDESIRGERIQDLGSSELNPLLETSMAFRETGQQGAYIVLWKKDAKRESFTDIVPNGHVFVLGDYRDASNDSRYWGHVPIRDITGPLLIELFVVYPPS